MGAKEMLTGEATELSGVRVIDDLTLEVTIDGSKPYFLGKLAYPTAYVVDRANVARGMNWTDKPNGTGPFRLKEWKKDELLILEYNANYYLEPAKLEYVVLQIFAGRSMMMYEQGEIVVTGVYIDDLDRVLDPQNPLNKELLTTTSINMGYLGFNVTKPPFDDPKVRRAFALALDMDKILEVSLKGNAERAGGFLPPGIPGHNDELEPLPFDPELARQLIAESKYGSVDNLPPIVLYDLYSLGPVEEAAVAMWRENLGVEVEAQVIEELEEWLERAHRRELQLFFSGWQADFIDPQNFLEVLFHSQSKDNWSAYSNPEVDAALEKAAVEQDEGARLRMYQDIEKMILEDLPVAPFYQSTKRHVLVKPYVEGYYLAPMGIHIWKDISIEPH
jgi:ABC-type transport system substrate-binding protein